MLRPMPPMIAGEPYLTVLEVAERLSRDPETVRRWIRRKRLPAKKVGFQYFIREKDAEAERLAERLKDRGL